MFATRTAKSIISAFSGVAIALSGLAAAPAQAVGTTIYIAQGVSVGDGTSCTSPQYTAHTPEAAGLDHDLVLTNAMDAAASGDTIVLCDGTWTFANHVLINKSVTIKGNGAKYTVVDGNNATGLFQIKSGDGLTVALSDMEITGGNPQSGESGSTNGEYNTRGCGGALYITGNSTINLSRLYFNDNNAGFGGGAICFDSASAALTIESSSFANNSADLDGADLLSAFSSAPAATIKNTTFYNGMVGRQGHAISKVFSDHPINIYNSTIVNTNAGAYYDLVQSVNLVQSVLWRTNNHSDNCSNDMTVDAATKSNRTCSTAATYTEYPFGAFAYRGGSVPSFSTSSSDLLDQAECNVAVTEDARGVSRPQGASCDLGAFELNPSASSWTLATTYDLGPEIMTVFNNDEITPTSLATVSPGTPEISYASSTTNVCEVDSSTGVVTAVATGTCTVKTTVLGDATHNDTEFTESIGLTVQVRPEITWMYFSGSDEVLSDGESADILVEFSEDVTVTGTPQLKLETGATDGIANFVEMRATNQARFRYVAAASHKAKRIGLNADTPLLLNGGSIKNAENIDLQTELSENAQNALINNSNFQVNPDVMTGRWTPVGEGSGAGQGSTFGINIAKNGDLLAAGDWNQLGADKASDNFARYSQAAGEWYAMTNEPGQVTLDDDGYEIIEAPNGDIYAGGNFSGAGENSDINYIARWDGDKWNPVKSADNETELDCAEGDGSCGVFAMAFGPDGELYVGGRIDLSNDSDAANVLKWDGENWSSLAPSDADATERGLNNSVRDIVVDSQGNVIVGGLFSDAAGIEAADYVAKWDGEAWSSLGADSAVTNRVMSLAVGKNDAIYVGSQGDNIAGIEQADYVAKWDGTEWSALGDSDNNGAPLEGSNAVNDYVLGLAVDTSGANDVVYVAGDMDNIAGIETADAVAVYEDGIWSALGDEGTTPVNNYIRDIVLDKEGRLYVGGWFENFHGIAAADGFAFWDGMQWSALAPQPGSVFGGQDVFTVRKAPNGDLYAGGSFTNLNGDPTADYIVKWDGEAWTSLGSRGSGDNLDGFFSSGGGGGSYGVFAIDFDSSGNPIIGGNFSSSENTLIRHLAKWNGTTWVNLGTNTNADGPAINGSLRAVKVVANGDVYIGGMFTDAGDVATADKLARWNGTAWSGIGNNNNNDGDNGAITNTVHDIEFGPSGSMYVSGQFQNAAGISEADRLAKWNGTVWSAIGSNGAGEGAFADQVLTIEFVPGQNEDIFYVGGNFSNAAGGNGDKLMYWNGTAWQTFGPNGGNNIFGGIIRDLEATADGDLLIAGGFWDVSGDYMADRIVYWDGTTFFNYGDENKAMKVNDSALNCDVFDIEDLGNGSIAAGGCFDRSDEANGLSIWDPSGVGQVMPTIDTRRMGDLEIGTDYDFAISEDDVEIADGELPDGMSLNTNTGVISGSPTTLGTYDFTARVSTETVSILHHYYGEVTGEESDDPLEAQVDNQASNIGDVNGTLDGNPINTKESSKSSETQLIVSGTGFQLGFSGIASDGRPLGLNNGNLVIERGRTVEITGSGYAPNSTVRVYGLSTPRLLGTIRVNSSGSFKKQVNVGRSLAPGKHTLQLNGYSADNKVRSIAVGVKVIKKSTTKTKKVTVYFGIKSAKLTKASKKKLNAAIKTIRAKNASRLTVKGYVQPWAPNRGDIKLSGARAKAVKAYLKQKGVSTYISTIAKGRAVGLGASGRKAVLSIRYQVPAE